MFPIQKGDLCFQVSNNSNNASFEQLDVSNNANDLFQYNYLVNNSTPTNPSARSRKRGLGKSLLANGEQGNNITTTNNNGVTNQGKIISGNKVTNKRVIHREIERQRRQEMASLFSSLRSILPAEYVKGKRSMSDHIAETAKYIKDLESSIKELGDNRDQLNKETCSSSSNKLQGDVGYSSSSSSLSSRDCYNVSIHAFSKAIEIEISSRVAQEDPFPLSRVLRVLNEESLDVVSCASSKVNNKWIYVIHCQVEAVTSVDSCQLQRRLNNELRHQE